MAKDTLQGNKFPGEEKLDSSLFKNKNKVKNIIDIAVPEDSDIEMNVEDLLHLVRGHLTKADRNALTMFIKQIKDYENEIAKETDPERLLDLQETLDSILVKQETYLQDIPTADKDFNKAVDNMKKGRSVLPCPECQLITRREFMSVLNEIKKDRDSRKPKKDEDPIG